MEEIIIQSSYPNDTGRRRPGRHCGGDEDVGQHLCLCSQGTCWAFGCSDLFCRMVSTLYPLSLQYCYTLYTTIGMQCKLVPSSESASSQYCDLHYMFHPDTVKASSTDRKQQTACPLHVFVFGSAHTGSPTPGGRTTCQMASHQEDHALP